jgi:flagellar hook-associated protein 2
MVFAARSTGSVSIGFQDVTGNFLAAAGATTATQALGKNALYRISSVAGGAQQSSAANTITGVVTGVELALQQASADPVTVTIGQDVNTAVSAVKDFVDMYNFTMSLLREQTKGDPKGQEQGVLNTDTTFANLEAAMRRMLVGQPTGMTGTYQTLRDIGVSFGAVGTAPGSANTLTVDQATLRQALTGNPEAVTTLLSGFQSTAALAGGGTGSVASISGTPAKQHAAGSYTVTTTNTGSISTVFTPTGGSAGKEVFGATFTAGGADILTIPGVTITATNPLVNGANTVNVSVQQKGVLIGFSDYLNSLVSTDGLFATTQTSADTSIAQIDKQVTDLQRRMADRRATLERQFATLETLMAKFQAQQAALQAQLGSFGK